MNRIMLVYPPGPMFMRGEDRCQANIEAASASSMRACNDLGYAAAVLLRSGYEVFLRDYQTEKAVMADWEADVRRFRPDAVMLSTTNATVFDDLRLLKCIKELSGAVMILKGAIFFDPPAAVIDSLDTDCVDYLIGGETDSVIGPLADSLFRGVPEISEVGGILYKKDGRFVPTDFTVQNCDLDAVPFPARQLMNNALYVRPDTGEPMATIQTSRGCPSACTFCLTPVISGKKVRFRSPENVFTEIEDCYYRHHIRCFFFKADTFTIDADWTERLCSLIIGSALHGKIEFTANSRVNPLRRETLAAMKQAGCFTVAFGFESGSEETLKKTKKGITLDQSRRAVKWAKELKLPVYGFFMIGFPWERETHLEQTKKLMFELDCDFIELTLALPFYGTPMYADFDVVGLITESVLGCDYFTQGNYGTAFLSNEFLKKFRDQAVRQYYTRPKYLVRKVGQSLRSPKVLFSYIKYGCRLLFR